MELVDVLGYRMLSERTKIENLRLLCSALDYSQSTERRERIRFREQLDELYDALTRPPLTRDQLYGPRVATWMREQKAQAEAQAKELRKKRRAEERELRRKAKDKQK